MALSFETNKVTQVSDRYHEGGYRGSNCSGTPDGFLRAEVPQESREEGRGDSAHKIEENELYFAVPVMYASTRGLVNRTNARLLLPGSQQNRQWLP